MSKSDEIPPTYSAGWIEKLDGRTSLAKAVQSRYAALANDLGGIEGLSYQRRSLCKRAIYIEAVIEQQEAALSRGEEVDQGRLTQAVNTLIGLLKTVGLERATRDVESLAEYIKSKSKA